MSQQNRHQHESPTSQPLPPTSSYPHNYLSNSPPVNNNWKMNHNTYTHQNFQQTQFQQPQFQRPPFQRPSFQQPNWDQGTFFGQYPQSSDNFNNSYQQYQGFNNYKNYNNFNNPNQNHNNYRNNNHTNNNFKKNFYNNNNMNNKNSQKRNLNENSQMNTNHSQIQNNKKQKVQDKVEYFCEICDREFKTDEKYQEHLSTHRTCSVEGCNFVAAEKLVKIHYQNFHASGVDKKVPTLNTPEEIEKYRNERKKNFPTNSNVEKKVKLDEEKCERGAVLETQQFGRLNKNKKRNLNSYDDTKKSEAITTVLDEAQSSKNSRNKNRNKNKNQRGKVEVRGSLHSKKPTLLQQLLADEIRHERNILLQCVRYIVDRNFFEPQKLQTQEAEAC